MGTLLYFVSRGSQLFATEPPEIPGVPTRLVPTENRHVFIAADGRATGEPIEFQVGCGRNRDRMPVGLCFPVQEIAEGIE
jgi:hypothetical protein